MAQRSGNPAHERSAQGEIVMPAPTFAPLLLAVGLALAAAGLMTDWFFSIAGGVLAITGLLGWLRQLFPGRGHYVEPRVPAASRAKPVEPAPAEVRALRVGMPGNRLRIPEKVHPYSAGLRGGIVGGIAMAIVALTFGVVSGHSIWYPVNLLAGTVLPWIDGADVESLEVFQLVPFAVATVIHAAGSLAVGLCYGALLPMFPRAPVFFGGVVGPLLWTGAIYGFMGVINPALDERIEWRWFFASQVAFGITAGLVIIRSEKVSTRQTRENPTPRSDASTGFDIP